MIYKTYLDFIYNEWKIWDKKITLLITDFNKDIIAKSEFIEKCTIACTEFDSENVIIHFDTENDSFHIETLFPNKGESWVSITNWFIQRSFWNNGKNQVRAEFHTMFIESYNPTKLMSDKQLTIPHKSMSFPSLKANTDSCVGMFDNWDSRNKILDAIELELNCCISNTKYPVSKKLTDENDVRMTQLIEYKTKVINRPEEWFDKKKSEYHINTCEFKCLHYINFNGNYNSISQYDYYKLLKQYNLLDSDLSAYDSEELAIFLSITSINNLKSAIGKYTELFKTINADFTKQYGLKMPTQDQKYRAMNSNHDKHAYSIFKSDCSNINEILNILASNKFNKIYEQLEYQ